MQPRFVILRTVLVSLMIGAGCGFLRLPVPNDGSEYVMPIVCGSMIGCGVFLALTLLVDLTKR